MQDIIKFNDGKLDQKAIDYITAMEAQKKAFEEQYTKFKEELLQAMEKSGIVKFEGDKIRINYIAESSKETFDSKQFRADMPELYNEYVRFSKVKPSVRIKVEQ